MKKLAIIITHPIQYYVPVFKLLAQQCQLKVFYTWGNNWLNNKYDPGFGKDVEWDIPLLDGYDYEFIENIAKQPGSHHSKGIVNPKLITAINHYQPHVLLVHGYSYQSHFKVMRYFKGKIPIWFRGDSTLLNERKDLKRIVKKIYLKWVYSFVDKVFYVGTNNKAYFKKYGLKENQLIFSPHAIDNERFAEDRMEEVAKLKQELGILASDITILYAGKFENVKNLFILIQAFKIIQPKHKVKLLLVGNGPQEQALKKLTNDTANILFMDFQNQQYLPVIYHSCDIFCLPSKSETWGLAINEAMAAGKAIIASDKVGCALDLVKNGINGYIFKSNDVADVQEKLCLLISQPELIKEFGKQSKEIIQNWSFEQQVQQFIKTLNETN